MKRGHVKLAGIGKSYGTTNVLRSVDLEIQPGEFFALLGPSGSGKTTTLRIVAGLEVPTVGQVLLDGEDATTLPPGKRDVAMVFQSYALYPHMSVFENIAFPLRNIGTPAGQVAGRVRDAAARVKIDHLLQRKPGELSGGQQQRVALARAIVRQPALFLLDEPLSNLDAKLRAETRVELKRLQRSLGVTAIYVTHDQEEAMSLADRMAVFMNGALVQQGTPAEVFRRPASVDVAAFLGNPPMNLLPARIEHGVANLGGSSFAVPALASPGSREVVLGIRPPDVAIAEHGVDATVTMLEDLGDDVIVDFAVGDHLVRARSAALRKLAEGERVKLHFDETSLHVFDRETGLRVAR